MSEETPPLPDVSLTNNDVNIAVTVTLHHLIRVLSSSGALDKDLFTLPLLTATKDPKLPGVAALLQYFVAAAREQDAGGAQDE